ncbi:MULTISPECIES: 23S rRNA (uracil(747)-C(5))-methyltransferase RlmC [unclassified Devosia]|uniref:23S rRNA (uracil(747)-C(5))-methyltransferase RlmC n=1 Tax=unclassified Devosia TaxID=196773 RepID=UPI0023D853CA|nr:MULTISPECIES: 23S rRNA (uracil(747)-C(5))-methyltransferase RlmC [unclassified Devosia]WEJ32067.1 23S rRNA (uracil(747)-C(5))-methyltransferase RlmC [Devosia sp. SD17-2]
MKTGLSTVMHCDYFDRGVCRSCTLMGTPYDDQIAAKTAHAKDLLAAWPDAVWLPPMVSRPEGFRNKAKMVVGGTADAPTLGILDPTQHGVDLTGCGILADGLRVAFEPIKRFIARARIAPYDVPSRRGELKHVLLTESADGALMLRFVLRSTEPVGRMQKHLAELLAALPQLVVVTANLLPEHKAVLEGDEEILLAGSETLPMRLGDIVLHLRPASFFQTNTDIAIGLYHQARDWVDERGARSIWDLYCGVGGFALHVAAPGRRVHGIEISAPAVASAQLSASEAGLTDVSFAVGDATALGAGNPPDVVIVNPPRRGLGDQLCETLEATGVATIIYSSCNAVTLARDIAALPSYRPERIRLFDMFPQTDHYEAMVLLTRHPAQ